MSSHDLSAETASRRLGRYELIAPIGRGGMATVYLARMHGTAGFARVVAVKVLHQRLLEDHELVTMFLDEARLAARIRHANVVEGTTSRSSTASSSSSCAGSRADR